MTLCRIVALLLVATLCAAPAAAAKKAAAARKPPAPAAKSQPPAPPPPPGDLTPMLAAGFAQLALSCIDRPYPYKPDKVYDEPLAVRPPLADFPSFYGCFDWHSAVHGHWMLVRVARLFPDQDVAQQARAVLAPHLSAEALADEAKFFEQPAQKLFERPYGWAWALRLAAELRAWDDDLGREWAKNIAPLEKVLVERFKEYLVKLPHPVRTGVHGNTAFALREALDYARIAGDAPLAEIAQRRAREFYSADRHCPVHYEPSGEDFFSPCLMEADLMRRILPAAEFGGWLDHFLPGLRSGELGLLSKPAVVTDPADGRIVHLDGLNLTRAWCLKGIATALAPDDPRRKTLAELAQAHAQAGLARVASGHYEGEHWLASFAVYLLSGVGVEQPSVAAGES